MAFPFGAIIGAGASIFGAGAANKQRRQESNRQRQFSESMWNKQNAYNTPANQIKRLKEAGLNPALMYGQGTVGNAEKAMGYQQPQLENIGAGVAQSAAAGAQLSVMNSQKKLNEANAIKSGIEGSVKAGEFQIAKEMSKFQMDKLNAETSSIKSNTKYKILELQQAAKTGMLKGNNIGNVASALSIDIGTPEGKKEFKNIIYSMLGYNAALRLGPDVIRLLSQFGFRKGMSSSQFNKQADKWLNTPTKLD